MAGPVLRPRPSNFRAANYFLFKPHFTDEETDSEWRYLPSNTEQANSSAIIVPRCLVPKASFLPQSEKSEPSEVGRSWTEAQMCP